MSEVVGINANKQHMSGPAKCLSCHHEWKSRAPVGTIELDCPKCKSEKGVYMAMVAPHKVWTCCCGNQLFYVSADEVCCANCGNHQEGF